MIRTCPKCGASYADSLLAFCLVDGMPLVDVDPHSENWSQVARSIEEQENALRKQKRGLKWRRVLLTTMTTLIATMVVCVVAVNSLIYLKPRQEEAVPIKPSTLATAPVEPGGSNTPSAPVEPTPASSPSPTETPEPTLVPIVIEITTPTGDTTSPTTPTPTPTLTWALTPTPTPTRTSTPTPTTPSSTPLPISTPPLPPSPLTPTPTAERSDADKSRERATIINRFGDIWRRNIEGDRRKIIVENARVGVENLEAGLGAIEYNSTFFKRCTAGLFTVRYMWQVRTNVNATIKVVSVAKEKVSPA
jgi:hypothetical protein